MLPLNKLRQIAGPCGDSHQKVHLLVFSGVLGGDLTLKCDVESSFLGRTFRQNLHIPRFKSI